MLRGPSSLGGFVPRGLGGAPDAPSLLLLALLPGPHVGAGPFRQAELHRAFAKRPSKCRREVLWNRVSLPISTSPPPFVVASCRPPGSRAVDAPSRADRHPARRRTKATCVTVPSPADYAQYGFAVLRLERQAQGATPSRLADPAEVSRRRRRSGLSSPPGPGHPQGMISIRRHRSITCCRPRSTKATRGAVLTGTGKAIDRQHAGGGISKGLAEPAPTSSVSGKRTVTIRVDPSSRPAPSSRPRPLHQHGHRLRDFGQTLRDYLAKHPEVMRQPAS
jgi:hypothetical protein